MTPSRVLASCVSAVGECNDTQSTDLTPWLVVAGLVVLGILAAIVVAVARRGR